MQTTLKFTVSLMVSLLVYVFAPKAQATAVQAKDATAISFRPNPTLNADDLDVPLKSNLKNYLRKNESILKFETFIKLKERWRKLNVDPSKGSNSQKPEKAAKYDLEEWLKLNGGVTDGGGNRVNDELYDYWVKSGIQLITVEGLVRWNEELVEMLEYIKEYSPESPELSYAGWYQQIIIAAQRQTWVLDSKPISNVNCWNLSANTPNFQEIIGCNSVRDVKINGSALFGMNDANQAGFFMHELLLSWAKERFGTLMTKYDLEEAVREINVAIRDRANIREVLRRYFPRSSILSTKDIQQLKETRNNMFFSGVLICKGEPVSNANLIRTASMSPIVRLYLGKEIQQMMTVLNAMGTEKENFSRIKFCYDLKIYKVESLDRLPSSCKRNIDNVVDKNITTAISLDLIVVNNIRAMAAQELAMSCVGHERPASDKEQEMIFIQALDYFEKSMQRYQYLYNQSPFVFSEPRG